MENERRSNQGYEIIESCTIGSTELVIGHNPKAPNPYVCWYARAATIISGGIIVTSCRRHGRN